MTVGYAANAAVMGIDLENLEIKSEGDLDLRGFLGLDPTVKPGYDEVRYTVTIRTSAPSEQVQILLKGVMATLPNFFNFANPITMKPELRIETPLPTY